MAEEPSQLVILLQIIDQIDHFSLTHGGRHGLVGFVKDPEGEDDPEAVEEGEVEPAWKS